MGEIWDHLDRLSAELEGPTVRAVATAGVARAAQLAGAARCSLYLDQPDGSLAKGADYGDGSFAETVPAEAEWSLSLYASKHGAPLLVEDTTLFRREHGIPTPPFQREARGAACVVLPLTSNDGVCGVLNLSELTEPVPPKRTVKYRALTHAARLLGTTITRLRRMEELEDKANRDGLTGLFHHSAFLRALAQEIERAQRYDLPLSVLLIDLDEFKSINDVCGHPAGDEVLRQLAARIVSTKRGPDLAARYGGDEFAMILPQTAFEGAIQVAQRLRGQVGADAFQVNNASLEITASVGVTALQPGDDVAALIQRADEQLYLAKERGRDRVVGG